MDTVITGKRTTHQRLWIGNTGAVTCCIV